jgi:Cu(I)/Ag(I) efflux system periplasmic protein CusF
MNKKLTAAWTLLAALALPGPALAQSTNGHDGHHPASATAAAEDLSEGEVRRVDRAAGKLTLKHGPIRNLDMPGMTMVFQVRNKALLDKVQAGDKVRFRAESDKGAYFVTTLQPAP